MTRFYGLQVATCNETAYIAFIQGVYNSWKYWKSPGILLLHAEKFVTQSYTSLSYLLLVLCLRRVYCDKTPYVSLTRFFAQKNSNIALRDNFVEIQR